MHLEQKLFSEIYFVIPLVPVTAVQRSKAELSMIARKLGSWVRIPYKAWMFGECMRLFCVCVVRCLGGGLATS
jgi:hypothetical protein